MLRVSSLSECTFEQALQVWNQGFRDYFSDMTMTMDKFVHRFGAEGLSPDMSLVAWAEDQPVGFILNGIRIIQGKRVSWNGGTGVVPEYRGKGVGRALLERCISLYRHHDVDTATLEAIRQNEPAIRLYERFGYRVNDTVTVLARSGSISDHAFWGGELHGYVSQYGLPQDVASLTYYRSFSTWQTQWPSVTGGQSLILSNEYGLPVAYALYRVSRDHQGKALSITLHQCEVSPLVSNADTLTRRLLRGVFAPCSSDCRRIAFNIPSSSGMLMQALKSEGFETAATQVVMTRPMKG